MTEQQIIDEARAILLAAGRWFGRHSFSVHYFGRPLDGQDGHCGCFARAINDGDSDHEVITEDSVPWYTARAALARKLSVPDFYADTLIEAGWSNGDSTGRAAHVCAEAANDVQPSDITYE